jgi:CubicO group peptidase (beta-lactamase class C family)
MFMPEVIARTMDVPMPVDLKTIIRFALSKNLHFTPGTGQSYSNLGYSILGLVIEEASGMDYETYCRRKILEPLGIFDMSWGVTCQRMRFLLRSRIMRLIMHLSGPRFTVPGRWSLQAGEGMISRPWEQQEDGLLQRRT